MKLCCLFGHAFCVTVRRSPGQTTMRLFCTRCSKGFHSGFLYSEEKNDTSPKENHPQWRDWEKEKPQKASTYLCIFRYSSYPKEAQCPWIEAWDINPQSKRKGPRGEFSNRVIEYWTEMPPVPENLINGEHLRAHG